MMRILLLLISACALLSSFGAVEVDQDNKLLIVTAGDEVKMGCKQDQSNYLYMYWYEQKAGQGLKLMVLSIDAKSEEMEKEFQQTWSIKRPDIYNSTLHRTSAAIADSAVYFCAASVGDINQKQEFGSGTVLSVLEKGQEVKPPIVTIYRPSKQELEDHKFISLVCVASGFFPEHVKIQWFVDKTLRPNLYEPVPKKSKDGSSYSTSKRLTLTRSEYFNPDTVFRCEAAFLDEKFGKNYAEVRGETDCGVSKETYSISINQGKISYIMVLCKSALYALIVLILIWRKKVNTSSY
ncbi:M1-specific T cell receptor beta chain-like [Leptodactylus fuscus]|uniref:M1-specific T cell receptor beta chain-like n=1 Tax=Leptodactylus fuscus TaxID=238119 RepID=UPI003F4F33D6